MIEAGNRLLAAHLKQFFLPHLLQYLPLFSLDLRLSHVLCVDLPDGTATRFEATRLVLEGQPLVFLGRLEGQDFLELLIGIELFDLGRVQVKRLLASRPAWVNRE